MNPIMEYLTGMDALTDQIVAMDLLNSAKSGVRNYAMAATEAGTPEVKAILTRHLEEAIDMHEQISRYMMEKGWYHPWNTDEQVRFNLQNIDTALRLPVL
ncbi:MULTISPECIES: spore coat protein [Bacillus]|uniref:Spore coat protein n=1 Tax=Bacillus siamensis TaxID=659243 RepID=A0AAI8HR32_9BACI|nr:MULTISPECIES: spore coat protein [Bacillus]AME06268.1 spore gernimation protein GerQ [Bacillus sp. SDLI1]AOU00065.1 spore coat protein [Bacillus velezensis]AQS42989.1 spore coat protein [Bacillus velezensis]AUJ78766.1 spore coat protein [Bacillus siamensis]MBA5712700.1 spore coat protein [Bacillus velezensis]